MNGTLLPVAPTPDLLVLAPSLPCPPDRGDRLRWYHMLAFLSQHYRVHLGCFADIERDRAHIGPIKAMCYETCFVKPPALVGRLRVRALALARHDDPLAAWVEHLLRRHPFAAALA